jgi:hypothetical protein
VQTIYRLLLSGKSHGWIARQYGVDRAGISKIASGKAWAHLLGTAGAPTLAALLAIPKVKWARLD